MASDYKGELSLTDAMVSVETLALWDDVLGGRRIVPVLCVAIGKVQGIKTLHLLPYAPGLSEQEVVVLLKQGIALLEAGKMDIVREDGRY